MERIGDKGYVWQQPTPDTVGGSSTSSDPKVRGLRKRLEGGREPKETALPASHLITTPIDLTAAFFGSRQAAQRPPAPSPSTSSPDIVELPFATQLKDGYNTAAGGLCESVFVELNKIQADLSGRMDAVTADDQALLKDIEGQYRKIAGSLSSSNLRFDYTDSKTGVSRTEKANVGERVAAVKQRLNVLETEVEDLWTSWEEAQGQVNTIYEALVNGDATGNSASAVQDLSKSLKRDMEAHEEELEDLIDQAAEEMKESEKGFQMEIESVIGTLTQRFLMGRSGGPLPGMPTTGKGAISAKR